MIELSPAQIEDLTELVAICQDLSTDVVIIGAVAYNVFIEDVDRHTGDVDVAVALDLDDFVKMQDALKARGLDAARTTGAPLVWTNGGSGGHHAGGTPHTGPRSFGLAREPDANERCWIRPRLQQIRGA
jgi:hypothetical protein